ncbi:DUF2393 domain-containing protein [Granulicella cerasi]|uniref:DUF2393 domain-containing protein n=1 Tax=Granulicella cerasi TaxID=741063 RepID=A0ABW1ZB46_9BACT|nr:DUF2393 domain-containing protein [Granulicella cerasi]
MSEMFTSPTEPTERKLPTTAISIAAVAVVLLVAVLVLLGRRHGPAFDPTQPQPPAAYATNLEVSNITLSESDTMTGGKLTYIDGHVVNKGDKTVTGITAQLAFPNDAGTPPQIATEQMQIIRMRVPEVNAVPMNQDPIAPGAGADFRVIVENVAPAWNTQNPKITAIAVATK